MSDERPKLADGTGASRYAPMLGDIVTLDTRALDPRLGLYGVRVGYVWGVNDDGAKVYLPGFPMLFIVPPSALELLWRRPKETP